MSTFEERKKAEEARQVLKDELRFKAEARRNKLLGLWAAEMMGHADPAAYAAELVAAAFAKPGIDHLLQKVADDLEAAGISMPVTEIGAKSNVLFIAAEEQVFEENSGPKPQN